ncbi:MAG: hypothetical protein GX610_04610 [Rhodococcus sp.]|uniref:hypothetical protein n=1 Tax=unclassified Rhodococcus (in: high G+C Gram-positive bacteria) TaxID=192944 RepID=UPI00146EF905|nr:MULTISPECIES: hypothetical protein [unclassified Rhodococcus (in: high G+C Gram-positive bacteria)]MCK0091451.1 hypothetical protein [Rhodococcus sp. F64268]NLE78855.1 hypothetical protein [Rhodococcus sp. (in: high G+C Gram-positive bacteria)]NLU63678.1 hypothetical protein [Rhodococcus sp. HNM0563]
MKTPTKVAGFILSLVAVFALAFGAGTLTGPENTSHIDSPSLPPTTTTVDEHGH